MKKSSKLETYQIQIQTTKETLKKLQKLSQQSKDSGISKKSYLGTMVTEAINKL